MIEALRLRAWRYIHTTFPERQIYIRTGGQMQFYALSPLIQAISVGAGLAIVGWVSFTSVNAIFGDRILAAKERRFDEMQASYESRIADLLLSYDELNGALVTAQDHFTDIADTFEAKQQALAALIERKQALQSSLTNAPPNAPPIVPARPSPKPEDLASVLDLGGLGMGGIFDPVSGTPPVFWPPPFAPGEGPSKALPETIVDEAPSLAEGDVADTKPVETTERPNFFRGVAQKLGALFRRKVSANTLDHPLLRQVAMEGERIAGLTALQQPLLAEAATSINKQSTTLTRALRNTGVDSTRLLARVASQYRSQRGSLQQATADDGFNAQLAEASNSLDKLSNLITAVRSLPLVAPVDRENISSGFGERTDPFNEQLAFHTGIDFTGVKGSDVHATAGGVVVFAGSQGAYGNTVEIDHGYGIRTRYGHLARILVHVGSRVDNGTVVGQLGSTGRSTGPHVHYEVWSDDTVRDPSKFIKAGRNVYEAQGS